MSAVAQMFLHLTFSCPALREAVVSPNLPSVLLEEEEEAEEEGRRRRRGGGGGGGAPSLLLTQSRKADGF